jgi:opacity protein-like surface antigen
MNNRLLLCTLTLALLQWVNGFTTCACPQEVPSCTSYYVSIFGAPNFMEVQNHHHLHLTIDTGYVGAFAIGYAFNPFRLEGEVSYRWNQISKKQESSGSSRTQAKPHTDSLFWMINSYYDCCWSCYLTPYIGLGIGFGNLKTHAPSDHQINNHIRSNGIAFQTIGGIKTRIWGNIDLAIEYRYLAAHSHVVEQSAGLALSYAF